MDLSVIILSYNTKEITGRCLSHLLSAKRFCEKKLKNKIEIIVIDNSSKDGTVEFIKQDFPGIKLYALGVNTGFSRGNNLGMKKATKPYILLLNSDVYVSLESLYKALAYFRVNLNCSVLGGRLTYANGGLQPSAGNLPNPLNSILWIFGLSGFHPKNSSFFKKAHKVGWVMGAFFMLKQQVFEKSKGFDENLFMYFEEIEWCKRIWGLGFKIWYVPTVQAIHLHGASSNFNYNMAFLNEIKGIKYYLRKHFRSYLLITGPFLILGLIFRIIAFTILRNTNRAKVYMEALRVV